MVIFMRLRIDIERNGEFAIPFKTCTLIVTFERLLAIAIAGLRSVAFQFLLQMLAIASNEQLVRTWFLLFAWIRGVALLFARVTTRLFRFAACLLAGFAFVLAVPGLMALLAAGVGAAFQFSTTDLATVNFGKPALLVFERFLAACAWFLNEKGTSRTGLVGAMAVVRDLWMAADLGPLAVEATRWWLRTARKGWRQNCTAAITTQLVEDRFSAATAWAFVAELRACMITTFQ